MSGGPNWKELEVPISGALKLARRPVAVAFLDAPPAASLKIAQFPGTEPSGCSFWRLAAEGRVFYTVLRGSDLAAVAEALAVITGANAALTDYAQGRRSQLSTL